MWKNVLFWLWKVKKGTSSLHREMEIPSKQVAWGEVKLVYNGCPLMCEVRGVSVMAEIHYNSKKWSNGDSPRGASYS
jgi:hypothetical protein